MMCYCALARDGRSFFHLVSGCDFIHIPVALYIEYYIH